jgi:V8-like Glu-specific endopeptidase
MELRGRGPDAVIDGRSARTCLLGLLVILAVLLPGLTPAKASATGSTATAEAGSGSVTGTRLETPPEVALDSWTTADFQQAEPAEAPVGPAGAFDVPELGGATTSVADGDFVPTNIEQYPLSTHGKVFFRVGSDEYVCSGTVVSSRGQNVIFTAGHCVYDTDTSQYVDELVFVPAYDGAALDPEPFGVWAATAVFTSGRYVSSGDLSHDIGVVVVEDPVQDTVGARRIAFDLNPAGRQFTIYGYPAKPDPPYDGETMIGCRSETVNRDDAQGSPFPIAAGPCDMGSGSSGGGWITDAGYLNSVVSYGYCQDTPSLCGLTFGPYFTDQAKAIYTYPAVGGSADPTVTIDSGPRGRVSGSVARFRLGGSGSTPISFRCRVDRGSYFRCGSTTTLRRQRRGQHVLRVYAVDQTGRTSPGFASRRFSVTG